MSRMGMYALVSVLMTQASGCETSSDFDVGEVSSQARVAEMQHVEPEEPAPASAEGNGCSLPAVVVPEARQVIQTRADGFVSPIALSPGSMVQTGEQLFRSSTGQGEASTKVSNVAVRQRKASVRRARLALKISKRRLRELRALAGTVPHQEIVEAAEAVEVARSELAQAKLSTKRSERERDQARGVADANVVRAPFDGIVSELWSPGGRWHDGGARMLELVAVSQRVRFAVEPSTAQHLHLGDSIPVDVEPEGNADSSPRVARIVLLSPKVDERSGLVMVEAELQRIDDFSVRPGLRARVVAPHCTEFESSMSTARGLG